MEPQLEICRDPLLRAIELGDLQTVVTKLNQGSSPIKSWHSDVKPLDLAIIIENLPIARILIEHGARIVQPLVTNNVTALHCATICRQKDIVVELLEEGIDWTTKDDHGSSVLHMVFETANSGAASSTGSDRDVEREIMNLLQIYLDLGMDANSTTFYGGTALHFAVGLGLYQVTEMLINHGADVEVLDNQDFSPIRVLIERPPLPSEDPTILLQLLLSSGAKVQRRDLVAAFFRKRIDFFKVLLQQIEVTYVDENGQTWLHILLDLMGSHMNDWLQIFSMEVTCDLLEDIARAGEAVNFVDSYDRTPLHMAIEFRMRDVVESLAKYFTNVHVRNCDEQTILHVLTRNCAGIPRYSEVIIMLLSCGADIDAVDVCGLTPIQYAVQQQNLSILRVLKDRGVSFRVRTLDGDSLLHILSTTSFDLVDSEVQHEILGLLVGDCDVNGKNIRGFTPLHAAIFHRNWSLVNSLLEYGADVNLTERQFGKSLSDMLVEVGDESDVVNKLISKLVDIRSNDIESRTSIYSALIESNFTIAKCLIRLGGVDVQEKFGDEKLTLLHLAAQRENREVVEMLVRLEGADVNVTCGSRGFTPLHLAIEKGNANVVKCLVSLGADVNNRGNDQKMSPLHLAVEGQSGYLVKFLIDNEARLNAKTRRGETPLHLALRNADHHNRGTIMKILLSQGARVDSHDYDGHTPLYNCVVRQCDDGLTLLLSYGADVDDFDDTVHLRAVVKRCFMEHFTKLRVAGLCMSEFWKTWLDMNDVSQVLDSKYNEEVGRMKKLRIGDGMTFYNLLCLDVKRQYGLVCDTTLNPVNFSAMFPHYHGMVQKKYREARDRWELIEKGINVFKRVGLTEHCVRWIFKFLENEWLECIIESAEVESIEVRMGKLSV